MSSTLLEQTRALHADIDELEQFSTEQLVDAASTEQRVKAAVDRIIEKSQRLNEIYEDASGVRKDEITGMAGLNALSVFYDRLKEIRDLHRHTEMHDMASYIPASATIAAIEEPVLFSGPEGYGRYVDLHTFHTAAMNMKQFDRTDYLNFLRIFYKFDRVQKDLKNSEYLSYITRVQQYLVDFLVRTSPLLDVPADMQRVDQDFEFAWARGMVAGWTKEDATITASPLYCVACQHLFAKDSVFQAHLSGKKHQRAVKGMSAEQQAAAAVPQTGADGTREVEMADAATAPAPAPATNGSTRDNNPLKEIARMEYRITYLVRNPLAQKLEDTIAHVQKKLASTYEELVADIEDMENEAVPTGEAGEAAREEESDDEEKPIYNPKGLPLGWDGKPIPYWLWKLHGLNQEFDCEICGNHSYWGPRNFDRHFQEGRHQHGMRVLKVPNTKHFHGITKMADAVALFEKLKKEGVLKEWNPEKDEELEDASGNVYSKKMYDDLRRQGLI